MIDIWDKQYGPFWQRLPERTMDLGLKHPFKMPEPVFAVSVHVLGPGGVACAVDHEIQASDPSWLWVLAAMPTWNAIVNIAYLPLSAVAKELLSADKKRQEG